jgi:hypothetical protein
MTEQVPPTDPEIMGLGEESWMPEAETTSTGVPAVDTVLADLDHVDAAPLEEHLAMFEHAHESLRAALDAPWGGRSDPSA